jgi:lipopolysaccharide/colanic/teichoic acid biosynthesis glycosyltransferase
MTRSLRLSRRQALAVKRGLDVAGASVGLVIMSPVIAGTAVATLVTMGRPVFLRPVRPGSTRARSPWSRS